MKIKRVTVNLPEVLLKEAMKESQQGITETLVMGLELLRRKSAVEKASRLRGAIALKPDLGRAK